jgi:predicted ATP-dependent serine protease
MKTCENCGERVYSGRCTNCHEELYILDQYIELNMDLPDKESEFMQKVEEQQKEIAKKASMGKC